MLRDRWRPRWRKRRREKPSVDVRRVGARLAVPVRVQGFGGHLQHAGVHFSKPAKEKIAQMQAAGHVGRADRQAFMREYGAGVYLAPPERVRLDRAVCRWSGSGWW